MADNMNTKQPLICIGREYGSGGREIAEKLAEKLGIPCYDKLLIHKAAEKSGYTEHFLTQNEEQPFSIGSLLTGNPFADTVSMAHAFYPESQMAFDAERHATRISPRTAAACLSDAVLPPSWQTIKICFPFSSTPMRIPRSNVSWQGTRPMRSLQRSESRKWTACENATSIFTQTRTGESPKAMT